MLMDILNRGDLNLRGRPAYVVPLQDERKIPQSQAAMIASTETYSNLFRFAVWLAGNEDVVNFQVMSKVARHVRLDTRFCQLDILFGRKEDAERFKEWNKRYMRRIGNDPDAFIPPMPTNGTYRLSFVDYGFVPEYIDSHINDFPLDVRVVKQWCWIAHNTTGPVFLTKTGYAFANQKAAAAFILWNHP